ncbi:MAG: NitT/TauT family transport system substrate-binding protein [Petroclostridium sp.]|jgi:NitT/TauT family transport system substrate-binding protein|nr:NitT/TauT family transport system substrate-binding protein [Petroclostridium sp.]
MKRLLTIILFFILLLTFSSCGQSKKQEVVIGVMPDVNSVPFIIAAEKGLFDEQDVDVDVQLFMSAVERDTALQAGKIDGCVSDILAAAFSIQGGFDVKITSVTDGDYILLASKDSGISSIQQFKAADIGLSTNTVIEYTVDSIFEKNGIKENEINKVAVPKIPIRLEMLENGKLKGACLPQPFAALAQSKGAKVIAASSQQGLAPSVMVFSSKALGQKKQELKKIYKAYNKAVELINSSPASFVELTIEKAKFPAEVKDIFQLPHYENAKLPKEEDVQDVLNWMKEKGLLKQELQYKNMVEKGLYDDRGF